MGTPYAERVIPIDAFITFLPVDDLEAGDRFYSTAFGLSMTLDQGDCRIYRVAQDAYLGLCVRPTGGGGGLITFVTDDVESAHRKLVAAGATVVAEPEHSAAYGIHHAFYLDPAGNRIEVQRFEDPTWSQ